MSTRLQAVTIPLASVLHRERALPDADFEPIPTLAT
jgi:hypothetical protein